MNIHGAYFGTTSTGRRVDIITVENSSGASIQLLTYGARLISCSMPDREGVIDDVIVGKKDLAEYEGALKYHGATIGRYANRIAAGSFEIDGTVFELVKNHHLFQLHGGPEGLHQKVWEPYPMRYDDRGSVKFCLTSPDGEQGFPGNLDIAVTISLTEKNEVIFHYETVTDRDTFISHTNHAYWNLRGSLNPGTIHEHELQLSSEAYVEVGQDLLPTGALIPAAGTPFDFSEAKAVGTDLHHIPGFDGYDHNFVLRLEHAPEMRRAARVYEPQRGRIMEIQTNAPGLQFYSDIYSVPPYHGICLEAGELPDAMHHPQFPQPLLKAGDLYRQITVHSFSTD